MISRAVELTDVRDGAKLQSVWQWGDRDEFAVAVEITDGKTTVRWEFDRDIVIDGIQESAGLWDVKIRRTGKKTVELVLDSPDGRVVFECPRPELKAFVKLILPELPEPRLPSDAEMVAFLTAARHLKDRRFGEPW